MATGADTTLADQGGPVDSTVQLLYSDMQHKTYTDEFASALLNVAQLGGPNDHKEIQMVLYAVERVVLSRQQAKQRMLTKQVLTSAS